MYLSQEQLPLLSFPSQEKVKEDKLLIVLLQIPNLALDRNSRVLKSNMHMDKHNNKFMLVSPLLRILLIKWV